ncbi:3-methyl-2-oxobutanoate hydroxymethyltransferase [Demequina sp. SYSU T00068]|uniref:3-methyl-2-oxobutanoate hydroxymethyltransferase n=1 Tax=Demequina lignilytica TaxID=3051663 RepID=UPI00262A54AC|nr:3-methyl-2-oxobutanoate hydroxymethyltransferase [Demequina sp. SYSU T00068]MDN4489579.1 3-methyl-2-oxobutanoate hydroxymethyltransferase [Demequina sp. SYSU T00068]
MTSPKKVRIHHFREMKQRGEKITMLTAYDFPTAKAFDAAGVDMLLVGDSMGDNVMGYDSTVPLTIDEMIPYTRSVARAAERAFVVADLPFGTYEVSPEQAVESSIRMIKATGASAVKFEGGRRIARQVKAVTDAGIPFCGHLGFTPQSETALGGRRIQGRGEHGVEELVADALALQEAGAFAVVLEMVIAPAARAVTQALDIPTIGIGAGPDTDGQVLVWLDAAGVGDWHPRFSKQFGAVGQALHDAAAGYVAEVKSVAFPAPEHTFES